MQKQSRRHSGSATTCITVPLKDCHTVSSGKKRPLKTASSFHAHAIAMRRNDIVHHGNGAEAAAPSPHHAPAIISSKLDIEVARRDSMLIEPTFHVARRIAVLRAAINGGVAACTPRGDGLPSGAPIGVSISRPIDGERRCTLEMSARLHSTRGVRPS